MTSRRGLIMDRIKAALAASPAAGPETGAPAGDPESLASEADLAGLFARRWTELSGVLHRAAALEELEGVFRQIFTSGVGREVALANSARALVPDLSAVMQRFGVTTVPAQPDTAARVPYGLSGVCLALAYSGTVAVTSEDPGELSASLLPPVHVALLPRSCLVGTIAEALDRLSGQPWPRAVVFISGPSRTADIELTPVLGVHGPGMVHAVLLDYQ